MLFATPPAGGDSSHFMHKDGASPIAAVTEFLYSHLVRTFAPIHSMIVSNNAQIPTNHTPTKSTNADNSGSDDDNDGTELAAHEGN
ncbi:hypothetical protein ONZ45_g18036 [Pleurotus djamor]|nr:hypothetical protein ONZ45_g18036 [Pleurotus djamor]